MSGDVNKSYDDRVYEDGFYEERYNREIKENEKPEGIDPDTETGDDMELMEVIMMCEDCENRWEDVVSPKDEVSGLFCPMCGSRKVQEV